MIEAWRNHSSVCSGCSRKTDSAIGECNAPGGITSKPGLSAAAAAMCRFHNMRALSVPGRNPHDGGTRSTAYAARCSYVRDRYHANQPVRINRMSPVSTFTR